MEEHAVELIPYLLGAIVVLLGSFFGLVKWLANRLFEKIDQLEQIFADGMRDRRQTEAELFRIVHQTSDRVTAIEAKCRVYNGENDPREITGG